MSTASARPWLTLIVASTITGIGCDGHLPVKPLPQTAAIAVTQDFSFTISPDGNNLLFIASAADLTHARIVVLDLQSGGVRQLALTDDAFTDLRVSLSNDCWSADSRFCIGPVPGTADYVSLSPGVIIDASDPGKIRLTRQYVGFSEPVGAVTFTDFRQPFSCSDCGPGSEPRKEGTGERAQHSDGLVDSAVASRDLKKVYDVKAEGSSAAIRVRNGEKQRELIRFGASDDVPMLVTRTVKIERLRLSPDGRRLAFQVSYGSDFVTPPDLYVVDTQTKVVMPVAENVYYDVHWTEEPERLYFYKQCNAGGDCNAKNDYLYFVEF